MTYVSGFLTPVNKKDKDRYVKSAAAAWPIFKEWGATEQVETWGTDVPDGKVTSFPMAVKLEPDEVVVFSWIKWPDKKTADTAFKKMEDDPRMKDMDMPFDGMRMMWGGFETVFDKKQA